MFDPFKLNITKTETGYDVSYTCTEDEFSEAEIDLIEDILKNWYDDKQQWNTIEVNPTLWRIVPKVRS